MVLSNEMVLIEQYANNSSPGRGVREAKPPEAETCLAFGRSMEAGKLQICLLFNIWRCKKSQLSAVCMIQDHFSWLFQNNIFPWHFPVNAKPGHFPVFPDLEEPWTDYQPVWNKCVKPMSGVCTVASWVKSRRGRKLQFSNRQLEISDGGDNGSSKF